MIRALLISALFFFGPMLAMFLLRNLGVVYRFWMAARRRRQAQPDIIDITPHLRTKPSLGFVAVAVILGVASAYWAWHYAQRPAASLDQRYVPAHMDAKGHLVPGRMEPVKPKPDAGQPVD